MGATPQWVYSNRFKVLKQKNCQPRILYPAKLYFKNEGKLKTFPGKQNLREFVANRSSLPEKLKKILHAKKQVTPDGNCMIKQRAPLKVII